MSGRESGSGDNGEPNQGRGWSGLVKGGTRTLVGSGVGVNSGPLPAQLCLDLAPVSVGPGRGRESGRDSAAAPGPGSGQE